MKVYSKTYTKNYFNEFTSLKLTPKPTPKCHPLFCLHSMWIRFWYKFWSKIFFCRLNEPLGVYSPALRQGVWIFFWKAGSLPGSRSPPKGGCHGHSWKIMAKNPLENSFKNHDETQSWQADWLFISTVGSRFYIDFVHFIDFSALTNFLLCFFFQADWLFINI